MPINSKHRDVEAIEDQWTRCRDVNEGTDAVKEKSTKYLPQLSAQGSNGYGAYKQRALFFGATARTVSGLRGAVFRKDYTLDYPESKKYLVDDITEDGSSLDVLLRSVVQEILEVGRTGLLVDVESKGAQPRAYIAQYKAENILNWGVERVDGEMKLMYVTLAETFDNPDADGHDVFNPKEEPQVRLLSLKKAGASYQYQQSVYRHINDKWLRITDMDVTPDNNGVPLDHIPFTFINAWHDAPAIVKPPLLDLVDVNLSHYRTSADLEHGAHFTALPTPVLSGFDPKKTYRIGSGVAWVTSNPQARAQYLEYTGQGLNSLRDLKKDKEGMMAILGARFLEEQKRAVEAADTHKLRASGDSGNLVSIVGVIDGAVTHVLREHAEWSRVNPNLAKDIQLTLNKDFVSTRLSAQELIALMQLQQNGKISEDTFLTNLKEGEILPDGRTVEEEKDLIEVDSNEGMGEVNGETPIKRQFELVRDEDGKATGIKEA